MSVVYMAVTADKYELPILVTDKSADLARALGYKPASLSSAICRGNVLKSTGRDVRVIRVYLDDLEDLT